MGAIGLIEIISSLLLNFLITLKAKVEERATVGESYALEQEMEMLCCKGLGYAGGDVVAPPHEIPTSIS